jgi:hypothetical protein
LRFIGETREEDCLLTLIVAVVHSLRRFRHKVSPSAGYTIQTPGQPPTFVNPNPFGGGYTVTTPGQPSTFIQPNRYGADAFGRRACDAARSSLTSP